MLSLGPNQSISQMGNSYVNVTKWPLACDPGPECPFQGEQSSSGQSPEVTGVRACVEPRLTVSVVLRMWYWIPRAQATFPAAVWNQRCLGKKPIQAPAMDKAVDLGGLDLFSLQWHPGLNPEDSAAPLTVYGVVRKEDWKKRS
ncbi:hypothetical protein STEG23_029602 [Scotinomys teguina]